MNDMDKQQILEVLKYRRTNKPNGFSLMEIVIVLTIIALVIGAVLVGNDMIAQAKNRKQVQQITQVAGAIEAFRIKYNCFPGDCADPSVIPGATYSGNGNGFLEPTWNNDENKGFWVHLSQSAILPDPLVDHAALSGMRVPVMRGNHAGVLNAYGNLSYNRNVIEYGTTTVAGSVTVNEIMYIDNKMDDGAATCGSIRSSGYGDGTTIYAAAPTFPISTLNKGGSNKCVIDKVYNLNAEVKSCNLIYMLD